MIKVKSLNFPQISILMGAIIIVAGSLLIFPRTFNSTGSSILVFEETVVIVTPVSKVIDTPKAAPKASPIPVSVVPSNVLYRVVPVYPRAARMNGTEGTVVVKAFITSNGVLKKSEIKSSSGSAILDKAAVSSLSKWKFAPAKRGVSSINSWLEIPFKFALR